MKKIKIGGIRRNHKKNKEKEEKKPGAAARIRALFSPQHVVKLLMGEALLLLFLSAALVYTVKGQEIHRQQMQMAARTADAFMKEEPSLAVQAFAGTAEAGRAKAKDIWRSNLAARAANLEYIAQDGSDVANSETYQVVQGAYRWGGTAISRGTGSVTGPNGRETYYNLNMSTCVSVMQRKGYKGSYWVRSDGCKMFGNYIMVAANLQKHPKGSIVRSSRGLAIVVDTGGFAASNPNQLDIATNW